MAVRRLADRWPLGLASSSNRPVIDAVLERAGISDCFAVTVSGEEVTAGKPAPDVYLAAARRLAVDPADAVAVEDSTNGLRAAAAAGMIVIANPNREYPPEPDALALAALVVGSLDELTPGAIESAARRARSQTARLVDGAEVGVTSVATSPQEGEVSSPTPRAGRRAD